MPNCFPQAYHLKKQSAIAMTPHPKGRYSRLFRLCDRIEQPLGLRELEQECHLVAFA